MCSNDYFCCSQPLWNKWASPQILGIGYVSAVIPDTKGIYTVNIKIPKRVAGVNPDGGIVEVEINAVNIMEAAGRECTDEQYWIPGVAKSEADDGPNGSEYPDGFEPQPICPGTWVTLSAVTTPGWDDIDAGWGLAPEPFEHGVFKNTADSGYGDRSLRCFFSHPYAHDGTCD